MAVTMVDRAIQFAVTAHTGQRRKGTDTQYIVHPFGVAMLLAQAGCGPELIAAGLLHDTIEDCGVTPVQLAAQFGPAVAAIVGGCTEPNRSLAWEERKAHTCTYLRTAPLDVKLVACADKLHNVRTMAEDYRLVGEQLWTRFKRGREQQAWYYRSLAEAFQTEIDNGTVPSIFKAFADEVGALFGG